MALKLYNLYAFALYTLHFTLCPHNFALFTPDTVWSLGLAPLSCCVRTSSVVLNFRRLLRYFFPRFQRSTPVPTVDLWFFPYTAHSALRNYTSHFIFFSHFPPHTPHSTLYTPHSTLYTSHSTLGTPHSTFTRATHTIRFKLSHFPLYTRLSTLTTLPFSHWNLGLALHFHVARAHLPVVVNCRLALHDVFLRFQRSTPVPKVDLWIFLPQLSWSCLCWMSSFASGNSRQRSYVLIFLLTLALPSVFHAHHPAKLAFVPYRLPSSTGKYFVQAL